MILKTKTILGLNITSLEYLMKYKLEVSCFEINCPYYVFDIYVVLRRGKGLSGSTELNV